MSGEEKTPGQAAFAAYYERQAGAALHMPASWDMQSHGTRSDWEAAARAAIAAQQPQRVPELGAVAYEAAETGVLRDQLAAMTAERDAACEQSAVIRERLGQLAARLELSAAATEPSKKSDIERQTARRVRDIAAQEPAIVTAGTEHLAAELAERREG